jgi:hypothetical protein
MGTGDIPVLGDASNVNTQHVEIQPAQQVNTHVVTQQVSAPDQQDQSDLKEYRDWLIKADYKASEAYDKAVMTLSGGALGISITFIHDIAPAPNPGTLYWLVIAWCAFGASIACILISKLTSQWALRKAIRQVDDGTIYNQSPGQKYSWLTKWLNISAGVAFLIGVATLAVFAVFNAHPAGSPGSSLFR